MPDRRYKEFNFMTVYGVMEYTPAEASLIATMGSPVRCNYCGGIYDVQCVETISRHADCTVFKTPCCGKQADDRQFVGLPSFRKILR